jgi:transposase
MIEPDKRKAIYLLHQSGLSVRQIARRLEVSRNTVKEVIAQQGAPPQRKPAAPPVDPELLRTLYEQCESRAQRVYEELREKHGIDVPYSSVTRWLRQLGISHRPEPRCARVPDAPGGEMQHDTSPYVIALDGRPVTLIASLLYLRYSKRRYLRFYRAFNRFKMKCFFHQALMHWGHSAPLCIIDNTNLARLRGLGKNAVIVPEMEAFGRQLGFAFRCHERGHSDRKAGEERSFWTVETNFLPGRTFQDLEDINQQALEWSTMRMEQRPQGKGRLIPAQAFEHERHFLLALPPHLPAPYQIHERSVDQYGYVAFDANYYWAPEELHGEITVLEYDRHLVLCQGRQRLQEYPLAPEGVRGRIFAPQDAPPPRRQPSNRKHSSTQEEAHLRALDPAVGGYLDFCLQAPGLQRHVFVRRLFLFSRRLTPELFVASVQRAHQYKIVRLDVLERIAQLLLTQGLFEPITPEIDETFRQRDTYRQGALTDPPDLSTHQVPPPPPSPPSDSQPPEPNTHPEPPPPDSHG